MLAKHKAVIFVHGCFWHMHKCKYGKVTPKTNADFWEKKRMSNLDRDKRNRRKLRRHWFVLTIWECETRDLAKLQNKLRKFLPTTRNASCASSGR